jgi:NAD(P)-dependent dehydrogenase (short-subunit alcohol dehydrogenase family)
MTGIVVAAVRVNDGYNSGGSKGIGRLIVQALLAEGVNVSYCARNPRGDEFSTFQGAADNARAVVSTVDIANAADIKNWVKKSVDEFGKVDCVVANGDLSLSTVVLVSRN